MTNSPQPVPPPPIPPRAPFPLQATALPSSPPTLLERIAAASSQFPPLTKESTNTYLKTKFMSLPDLFAAIKTPLLEQGVAIYSQLISRDGGLFVRTTLQVVSGEEELFSDFPVLLTSAADSSSLSKSGSVMQRIGGFATYGTRYNLLMLLAVCPADADDDGQLDDSTGFGGVGPASLPGLPVGQAFSVWPQPGSTVVHPQAQYGQPLPAHYQQPGPHQQVPGAIAHPVQPHSVLDQQ